MSAIAWRMLRLSTRDLYASGRGLWVLCACLALGVSLIAASAGLYRQVAGSLLGDARSMFGGDLEVHSRRPLGDDVLEWMRSNGQVSLLMELRTMLLSEQGRAQLVELQVTDSAYPLYGVVALAPPLPLARALERRAGQWGAAFDAALARRLGLKVGDPVQIGGLTMTLRARIERQPDRSLRADWRGPPLLIAAGALEASGLIQPGARVSYRYRVRIDGNVDAWQSAITQVFADREFEVRTFNARSERMAEVLSQIGSALLLVAFSALFIGGLGVFNSVHAYLQGKLTTIATLRSLGLRDRRLAMVYLLQVLLLAGVASLAGALAGGALAIFGASLVAERLPLVPTVSGVALPMLLSLGFGLLTALTFALPAIGSALAVPPAVLFRGLTGAARTPRRWWLASALSAALTAALVLVAVPEPVFGAAFVLVVLMLMALLEGVVRALRVGAARVVRWRWLQPHFALRLALANLHRPGAPLRASLLSLGAALTLLVACALVVGALLRIIEETVPERAPTLVFYDIATDQLPRFRELMTESEQLERLDVAPLVLGRLEAVNGESLADSPDPRRALEARDEHKMSYRLGNFDSVTVERGQWWPEGTTATPQVAMEDREADQIGLKVGDRLRFRILDRTVEAELAAIYGQQRFQSRFWLEAIFSDGVLDPFITRYVGAAYLGSEAAYVAQTRLAAEMPNVVTVHTGVILAEARTLLGKASGGLMVISGVTLLASLLVLAGVMAGARVRQVYDATVLHALGARLNVIRRSLWLEYALLALLTSAFALALGGAIASAFLQLRLQIDAGGAWMLGTGVAAGVSVLSLGLGARWLLAQLRMQPALLLRAS